MADWGGYDFGERGSSNGTMVPQHGTKATVAPRVTLGGNTSIALGGETLPTFSMPISCTMATYEALRDRAGEDHPLTYSGITSKDSILQSLHDAVKVKDSADLVFATLDFVLHNSDTTYQTISQSITVDGNNVSDDVLEVTVSHGIEQNCGQASVVFPSRPSSLDTGVIVEIALGIFGSNGAMFSGSATGRGWDYWPKGFAVDARDRLDRMTYPYGGTERTYGTTTGGTIEQNLVEAMGIDSANTHIEDDGNTVAVLQSIIFRQGDRFLPWIRENDQICGYVTYTKAVDSAIYRTPYAYAGSSSGSYSKGDNIVSISRKETTDGMFNGIQVDGLTTELGSVSVFKATANSYIPSPPGTVTYQTQSNIIESDTRGSAVATILMAKLNIRQEEYTMRVMPPCSLEPADSILVTCDDLDLSGGTVLVTKVTHAQGDGSYFIDVTMRKVPA